MIKGINRQVIEVLDTGNIYYERALLVVRPEFATAQREVLEKEARHMLGKMRAPSAIKKKESVSLLVCQAWACRLRRRGGCAAAVFLFGYIKSVFSPCCPHIFL